MATPFEEFVNRELPRRSALLTKEIVGYDGDPNHPSAPTALTSAPKGTWYLRETPDDTFYRKDSSNVWVESSAQLEASEATGPIILTVETTGDDNDSARPSRITNGDWSANPFQTIQAAINACPKLASFPQSNAFFSPTITINVGAGNFTGAAVTGFVNSVRINGATRQLAVLATGPNTGIATSGSDRTLVLTGASWTVDNLQGKFLVITAGTGAGQIFRILSNTVDTLTLSGISSPALTTGSVFNIEEPVTFITSPFTGNTGIHILDCSGGVTLTNLATNGPSGGFRSTNSYTTIFMDLTQLTGSGVAFVGERSRFLNVMRSFSTGGFIGLFAQDSNILTFNGCGFVNCTNSIRLLHGLFRGGCTIGCAILGGTQGIEVTGCQYIDLQNVVIDNVTNGLTLTDTSFGLKNGNIMNCNVTFQIRHSFGQISNALTGSGNTGWGLDLRGNGQSTGNIIQLLTTPTITGALGEVTINGTDIGWANLSTSGQYAVDISTGARIVRE